MRRRAVKGTDEQSEMLDNVVGPPRLLRSGSGAPEYTHKRCAQQASSLNKRTFRIADRLIGNNCNNTSGAASRGLPPMQREALLCLVASRFNPSNRGSMV